MFMKLLPILLFVGCYLKQYPMTPKIVTQGTYKVYTGDSMGTAWTVDEHHLVTAGHMCETYSDNFVLYDGLRRFHAKPVVREIGLDGATDLCLLKTDATLDNALVVSDYMPVTGETVGYVGYPLGQFKASEGAYVGDMDGPESNWNNSTFLAECDHGASGSPVYHKDGVWGVLVRLRSDGDYVYPGSAGCVAIDLNHLKAFLNDASIRYLTPPSNPEEEIKTDVHFSK